MSAQVRTDDTKSVVPSLDGLSLDDKLKLLQRLERTIKRDIKDLQEQESKLYDDNSGKSSKADSTPGSVNHPDIVAKTIAVEVYRLDYFTSSKDSKYLGCKYVCETSKKVRKYQRRAARRDLIIKYTKIPIEDLSEYSWT